MVCWQYRVVEAGAFLPPNTFVELLGRLGEGGWELITVVERGSAVFKRPVPDGHAPDGAWAELVPAGPPPAAPPPPVPPAYSAPPTAPVSAPPTMSRLETLLRERGIDAPGAAAPLEEFAGRANVDALCAASSGGRHGVFVVVGNRVGVWDKETASVHPFSLAGFSTVTAAGRELTLHATQGFDVVLTITNEASAPQWIALLGKLGVRAG